MFWYSTIGLLLLAASFVLLPLLRQYSADSMAFGKRKITNVDLYRERMNELQRDLDSSNIDKQEFDNLATELHRNLLADVVDEIPPATELGTLAANETVLEYPEKESQTNKAKIKAPVRANKLIPLLLALSFPLLAYNMYSDRGYYSEIKYADVFRQALHGSNDPQQTTALVMNLKTAVEEDADNPWAWYFLGKSYFSLGMYDQSQNAYQKSVRFMDDEANQVMVMGQFVLASFLNNDRTINAETMSMIDRTLAKNPNDLSVLRVLATDAKDRENYTDAIIYWRRLIRANPSSSAARVYQSNITAAERILGIAKEDPKKDPKDVDGISVTVSLAQGLELAPETRVFIAARDANKEGMPPLAAIDTKVGELPVNVVLDNAAAVGPFNLSSADSIYISALVSLNGSATARSGDYRAVTQSFVKDDVKNTVNIIIAGTDKLAPPE